MCTESVPLSHVLVLDVTVNVTGIFPVETSLLIKNYDRSEIGVHELEAVTKKYLNMKEEALGLCKLSRSLVEY